MEIREVRDNKKRHIDLLLMADEQEDMIDRYLPHGEMFALWDEGQVRGVCVVTVEGDTGELKNLAVAPGFRGRGYGRALVNFAAEHYRGRCRTLTVGTGETPSILSFYRRCGFVASHRVKNFFTDNYRHPIIEEGIRLVDMIYMKMLL